MNDDELVCDMYSCLNLIINELHSIGLTKLEIWLKLQELHDSTTNVHKQKHCLAKQIMNPLK